MPKRMVDKVMERRLQREIEGLYGNEAITNDLDDTSAQEFLNWATGRVKEIVGNTEGMDDETADEMMYPQLRAVRRMARYVNRIVSGRAESADLMEKMIKQARMLYGEEFRPDMEKLQALMHVPGTEPAVFIQALKHFLEGEQDGEEIEQE